MTSLHRAVGPENLFQMDSLDDDAILCPNNELTSATDIPLILNLVVILMVGL